ncbi:MAG: CPBP family intramembrane metalloprotease [Elusimicrobia bacterium]|nr:CPBP family intramembrane metalloprotease [Elusimicrobiota bacterium]
MLNHKIRLSLIITASYMAIRALIYFLYPVSSLDDWFYRDILMCGPRLLGLFLAVWLFRSEPEGDISRSGWAYLYAVLLLISHLPDFLQKGWEPWPIHMVYVGIATSLVVGLFEEYLFRGALLSGLVRQLPLPWAIVISSLIFTVYHVQAQSLIGWPGIFLVGIVFANLRVLGFGLLSLSILHGLIDWGYFLVAPESGVSFAFLIAAGILAVLSLSHVLLTRKRGA